MAFSRPQSISRLMSVLSLTVIFQYGKQRKLPNENPLEARIRQASVYVRAPIKAVALGAAVAGRKIEFIGKISTEYYENTSSMWTVLNLYFNSTVRLPATPLVVPRISMYIRRHHPITPSTRRIFNSCTHLYVCVVYF